MLFPKVQLNFPDGFASRRLKSQLLKYKPLRVKIVEDSSDISLEFLVGNPYHIPDDKWNRRAIKRIENDKIDKVYWMFYSNYGDDTVMPEHLRNGKIITTLPSVESEYSNVAMIPLGAEPKTFFQKTLDRKYIIHTHGYDISEAIQYVNVACQKVKRKQCHIGADFDSLNKQANGIMDKNNIDIYSNLVDSDMRKYYNLSEYVSGLRGIEGFEMPIVEGAMCGCTPITYDLPCYKRWFNDFAIFIPFWEHPKYDIGQLTATPEGREKLVNAIVTAISNGSKITQGQVDYVRDTFSWKRIMPKIWKTILS